MLKLTHLWRILRGQRIISIYTRCVVCGKGFCVTLGLDRKIPSDIYYGGSIRFGLGMWASHEAAWDENNKLIWTKYIPWYTELKYRLIDLKRYILHQYRDAEYWECAECYAKAKEKCEDE